MTRLSRPSTNYKFHTVLTKNTFYFYNPEFEEYYEGHVSSIAQNIFLLKNKIENRGLTESVLLEHIVEVKDGLDAILTITGFSKESLQRLVTFVRVSDDESLCNLVNKESWPAKEDFKSEWSLDKIKGLIRANQRFAEGIVNIFFRGSTIPIIG
ncbi:MAG: DpnII family type II restriction endonuclease, partial [Candidatus Hodarchaeales archaeon]